MNALKGNTHTDGKPKDEVKDSQVTHSTTSFWGERKSQGEGRDRQMEKG